MMHTVPVCRIGRMELAIHPLIIVVLAGACVLGRLNELIQILFALSVHEAAHAAAAYAFGSPVRSVTLMPFGGVIRMDTGALPPHTEWCVAAAGPAASFISAGAAALTVYISPLTGARLEPFLMYSLTLGTVNLLPALPLDGGRIAKCILEHWFAPGVAAGITAWTGVAGGTAMLVACVIGARYGVHNLTLPVMGVFLLLAAIAEIKSAPEKQLARLWWKEDAVRARGMDVHLVAAHASMRGSEALRLLRMNRFNCLRVLDERMRTVGELNEAALLIGMAKLGTNARVGEILRFDRRGGM